jgi:hypothetical protein
VSIPRILFWSHALEANRTAPQGKPPALFDERRQQAGNVADADRAPALVNELFTFFA